MVYESNNPQTNLSITSFYQNLGYKWREFISEYDERTIPRIEIDGEIVPRDLLGNAPIQMRKEVWVEDEATHTFIRKIFNQSEVLLARAALEPLTYTIEQSFRDEWHIGQKPYIYAGQVLGWTDDSDYKTHEVSEFNIPGNFNYSLYSTWFTDTPFNEVYPKIQYITDAGGQIKRRMINNGNESWWEFGSPTESWENIRDSYWALRICEEEYQRSHSIYYVYKLVEGNWELDETVTIDKWFWFGFQSRFLGFTQLHQNNSSLYDKRINIFMDINDLISP